MKITPKATNGALASEGAGLANKIGNKATNATTSATKTDKVDLSASARVDLSSRAQDAKKAFNIAKGSPDVDEAKVAKYQNLIDSGKYKVDSAKVADKMVDEMLLNEYGSEE